MAEIGCDFIKITVRIPLFGVGLVWFALPWDVRTVVCPWLGKAWEFFQLDRSWGAVITTSSGMSVTQMEPCKAWPVYKYILLLIILTLTMLFH